MRFESIAALAMSLLGIGSSDSSRRPAQDPIPLSGITAAVVEHAPEGNLALSIRVFGPGWEVGEPADASVTCPYPYVGSGWTWNGVLTDPVSEDRDGHRSFRVLLTGMADTRVNGQCRLLGPVKDVNEGSNASLRLLTLGLPFAGASGEYRLEVVSLSNRFGGSFGSHEKEGVRRLTRERVILDGC